MNKTTKVENLFLIKKKTRGIRKKLGCKFIKVNNNNAKKGYDTDYKVSKIQTFISKFKDKKIKELEGKIKKLKLQLINQSV